MAKKMYIGVQAFIPRDLPEGYTQVESITSDGKAYINTEFYPSGKTRVVCDFRFTATPTSTVAVYGARNSSNLNMFVLFHMASIPGLRSDYATKATQKFVILDATKRMVVDKNAETTTINRESQTNDAVEFNTTVPILIFGYNSNSSTNAASSKCKAEMWSWKAYNDDGTLAVDLVPCINPDGAVGMYDMVAKVFRGNAYTSGSFTAGGSVQNVARKVKKAYVGAPTELDVYETQTITITSTNVKNYFTVKNSTYYFRGSGGSFTSTNCDAAGNDKYNDTSALTRWTPIYDLDSISFDYSVSSENTYDLLNIYKGAGGMAVDYNETYDVVLVGPLSGNYDSSTSTVTASTGTWTGSLTTLESLLFEYTKDSSSFDGADKAIISNVVITASIPVGTVTESVARRIRKGYVGVGGVARPFWTGGELEYYGTATALNTARQYPVATTVGNYALFGGGYTGSYSNVVDAYDANLTRSKPSALSTGRAYLAATTVGIYALFGGGFTGNYSNVVDAYNIALTRSTRTELSQSRYYLAATTVGNYALFGGGYSGNHSSVVDAYDTSLTRSTPLNLSQIRHDLAATTVGDYALFGGGFVNSSTSNVVDAYNTALTRSTPTALSASRYNLAATTVGDYALFGGGFDINSTYSTVVNAYNTSLTRSNPKALSKASQNLAATTVGDYALFGGGDDENDYLSVVNAYNDSLTRSIPTVLNTARSYLAATTVGDYALFGGGEDANGYSAVVDVYAVV